MSVVSRLRAIQLRLRGRWPTRTIGIKAISFALIGIVNTMVDYTVFLAARVALDYSPKTLALFHWLSLSCGCVSTDTVSLIAANIMSWMVAISGSYVMNSSITFAAESGGKLRWRAYLIFIASGLLGWLGNTSMLVFAAQVLLLPVWLAKAVAILASFVVNFSLSHFIVFRVHHAAPIDFPDAV